MSTWVQDSPHIDGSDKLYRAVLERPGLATVDSVTGAWRVHPGAFPRGDAEGISTHLDSILASRGRAPATLYPSPRGAIKLGVAIPRGHGLGVLHVVDDEEPDPDLSAAHCEIRTAEPAMPTRDIWRPISVALAMASEWVVLPARVGNL